MIIRYVETDDRRHKIGEGRYLISWYEAPLASFRYFPYLASFVSSLARDQDLVVESHCS